MRVPLITGFPVNVKMRNGRIITLRGKGEVKVGRLKDAIREAGLTTEEFLKVVALKEAIESHTLALRGDGPEVTVERASMYGKAAFTASLCSFTRTPETGDWQLLTV